MPCLCLLVSKISIIKCCLLNHLFPSRIRTAMSNSSCTITTQVCHPSNIGVDIILAHHVHYFACIPLWMFVFELALETLVSVSQETICLGVLHLGWESLGSGQFPRICRIELSCILVLPQVHSKAYFIFSESAALDPVMIIVRVPYKVNIQVCWCIDRLATFASSYDSLKLWVFRLDLSTGVTYILSVRLCLNKVVITLEYRAFLTWLVSFLKQGSVLNACIVLFSFLAYVIVIKTWSVINWSKLARFDLAQTWWVFTSQNAHQTEVIELSNVFLCKWSYRTLIFTNVELCCTWLMQRSGHEGSHTNWIVTSSDFLSAWNAFWSIDGEDGHTIVVDWNLLIFSQHCALIIAGSESAWWTIQA